MEHVYFDTSVFLSILAKQPEAAAVRDLLSELKADRVRIHTSILTVQEVSVSSFMHGSAFTEHHAKVAQMARIAAVTKEIALLAAKFEAGIILAAKRGKSRSDADRIDDNRRRKFDCFHLATAVTLGCNKFFALDTKFAGRCQALDIHMAVLAPKPTRPKLPGL